MYVCGLRLMLRRSSAAVATSRAGEFVQSLGLNHSRDGRFLSACEGFDSSVIATVQPAPVHRRVPYTFADVPLNAGRLAASQVTSTALQEHQRRHEARASPCPQKWMTTIHRKKAPACQGVKDCP